MKPDLEEIGARLKLNRIIAKDQVYVQDVQDLLDYISDLEAVVKCIKVYKEKCISIECSPKHCHECKQNCYPGCEGYNQCRNCVSTCLDDALARLEGDRHKT